MGDVYDAGDPPFKAYQQNISMPTNPRQDLEIHTMKPALGFTIKDSGQRQDFASGMVRDVTDGKVDYTLVLDGPMFKRWADHLTKGAIKYAARNWMKANGMAEYVRFKASALRHFLQWYWDETDEDHAAAVIFNINGAEYVKARMAEEQ